MNSLITFKDGQEEKISKEVQKEMNKDSVNLNENQWKKENMKDVCSQIHQWNATQLWLYVSDRDIIKHISPIPLPSLKLLSLYKNNIESIEGLNKVQLLKMTSFGLGENKIHCIREFKKCQWPDLHSLFIEENKIQEGGKELGEGLLFNHCDWIYLQNNQNNLLINDLSFIAKFKQAKINRIWIQNPKRINQTNWTTSPKFKYKTS